MAKRTKPKSKKPIEQYEHKDKKRANNPPVGLVDASTDAPEKKKTYVYDPHLDPSLQWAGKAERTNFEIPTVSLHVHERIDPRTIVESVRKRNGAGYEQTSLFSSPDENPPLREAIEFYKHAHNWSNRLIAGDSLLVMNSLLEKEGMAGKVQMIYLDPPYGISYGSNFQPFVNKREVKDGLDEDLTQEPETIRAFRDTWELGIHSYLTYLRDRLLLVRELLHEGGSCFVQISDDNLHLVRNLMDDVFGAEHFIVVIPVKKKGSQKSGLVDPVNDYLVWYGRSPRESGRIKFRPLFEKRELDPETLRRFSIVELSDGREFPLDAMPSPGNEDGLIDYRTRPEQLFRDWPQARLVYQGEQLTSGGERPNQGDPIEFQGEVFRLKKGLCWKTTTRTPDGSPSGVDRLKWANRLAPGRGHLNYKRYLDDFGYKQLSNWWDGLGGASNAIYVVQTTTEVLKRCILMTTDPGDLVFDPTCGSGTTAYVAEQWGRRWITCDTSRVAVTLAKQRLMTALFDFYELAHPHEGVGSGFRYKRVPHVTLGSIANNPEIVEGMPRDQIDNAVARHAPQETLYDRPVIDKSRARVAGPFTVEAVPAPMVKSPYEPHTSDEVGLVRGDSSVSRSGPTIRQDEWRGELLRSGIRGKGGQTILFSRVEPLAGTRWLQADAETKPNEKGPAVVREGGAASEAFRAVISFGPEHAPLEQRQVEAAIEEARKLIPRPQIVVFAAFQFDPEAAKDIDELNWPGVTVLKAQMNADLLTEDLKKKRTSNESFWLIGQPEIVLRKSKAKREKGAAALWEVEVKGFDYYNTRTGQIDSGGAKQIAVWMLDTDYDGRSLLPRQVFFPMEGEKDGWSKLAKNLKAEIDEVLIKAYGGTVSLPFEAGNHGRIAVKIVDDRGIESLKILDIA
jgi:adenine-specific DNA-methyltransferase